MLAMFKLRKDESIEWWSLLPSLVLAMVIGSAVVATFAMVALGTQYFQSPPSDLIGAGVSWGAVILVAVATVAKEWRAHLLPAGPWARGWALAAYAWPLQIEVAWLVVDLPTGHYMAARMIEATLGALIWIGLVWLISTGRTLGRPRRGYAILCLTLSSLLFASLTLVLSYQDGLVAMASVSEVEEDTRDGWTEGRGRVRVVHLSDLHITGRGNDLTREGNPPGQSLLADYVARSTRIAPDIVLITGDITDNGDPEQWAVASEMLSGLAQTAHVILSPGNHDLSGAYPRGNQARSRDVTERMIRFLDLAAGLNSGLRTADDRRLGDVMQVPSAQLAVAQAGYVKTAEEGIRMSSLAEARRKGLDVPPEPATKPADWFDLGYVKCLEIKKAFQGDLANAFPLTWTSPDGATRVFVLNSTPSASWQLGRSAIGDFDVREVARLDCFLSGATAKGQPTRRVIVLAHHPVVRPSSVGPDLKNTFNFAFLQLHPDAARSVVRLLLKHQAKRPDIDWFMCYGHRHEAHLGRLGGIWMVEAPNLRRSGDPDRGIRVLFEGGARWSVGWATLDR